MEPQQWDRELVTFLLERGALPPSIPQPIKQPWWWVSLIGPTSYGLQWAERLVQQLELPISRDTFVFIEDSGSPECPNSSLRAAISSLDDL